MSTDPAPSVTRGDITLQPAYFTCSLFVNPLREDVARLVQSFAYAYLQPSATSSDLSVSNAAAGYGRNTVSAAESGDEHGASAADVRQSMQEPMPTDTDASNLAAAPTLAVSQAELPSTSQLLSPTDSGQATAHPLPFSLFKNLWRTQGWCWLHFKVFDGRARESLVNAVMRIFSEYFIEDANPLAKVVALFGLYTFFSTQPALPPCPASTSTAPLTRPGPSLYCVKHISLSTDTYDHLLSLPSQLTTPELIPLTPYVTYLLSTLLKREAFHILPHSSLKTRHPLPREWFVEDAATQATDNREGTKAPKKKGRPTKRERAKKAKDALGQLDRWLDKNTYTYPDVRAGEGSDAVTQSNRGKRTTHTLISHPPQASLAIYTMQKNDYLDEVDPSSSLRSHNARLLRAASGNSDLLLSQDASGTSSASATGHATPLPTGQLGDVAGSGEREREQEALRRANEAVLARLKKIDAMAAEQGLEVGDAGGDMTGLGRVERAVEEMREGRAGRRGGILGMLEGAGTDGVQGKGDVEHVLR